MGNITITAIAEKNKTSLNALASEWLKKLAVKPPRGLGSSPS